MIQEIIVFILVIYLTIIACIGIHNKQPNICNTNKIHRECNIRR